MGASLLASEIAVTVGGQLVGDDVRISAACTTANPRPGAIGFVKSVERVDHPEDLAESSLWLVPEELQGKLPGPHIALSNPRQAFTRVMALIYDCPREGEIAETAIISPGAKVAPDAIIGHYCVVGPECEIGARTELRPHVVLWKNVRIGSDCLIKSHTAIGEEGFGFETDSNGNNVRILHVGGVEIGDHVEIGSMNTVCSGTIDKTIISDFTKTDDHVHIAHNCNLGRNCLITACAELSGSVTLGDGVWLGPNSSVLNGKKVGDSALVGIAGVVTKDCEPGGIYVGSPARKVKGGRTGHGNE